MRALLDELKFMLMGLALTTILSGIVLLGVVLFLKALVE